MNIANLPLEETVDDPLFSTPRDELAACARLLAISVAHHRAKFGVVPIAISSAQLDDNPSDDAGVSLLKAARNTLEEALDMVRRREAEQTRIEQTREKQGAHVPCHEQRRQMRISVTTAVEVSDLDGERVSTATLRNISWGGAAVRCDDIPAAVGGRVCLLLPAGRERLIKIVATVLRESLVEGEREYGLRFESLDPEDEDRLLEVLKILIAVPDQDRRRSEVRLVQRLEVEYGDAGEFQATLEDISASGLMLTVPNALEIGQSLLISLTSSDTPFGLNLRARVVHQTLVEDSDSDMYRVGLQFEHPSPQLRDRISAVINELAIMRPRDMPILHDSEMMGTGHSGKESKDAQPDR